MRPKPVETRPEPVETHPEPVETHPEPVETRPEPVEGLHPCASTTSAHMTAPVITTENVAAAFDEVAPRYDLMVALNPGYHVHLRAATDGLVELLPASTRPFPIRLLDLGCGSGASTRAVLQAAKAAGHHIEILGVDASAGMIAQAHAKHWPAGVRFQLGAAEDIACSEERPVNGVFAAYLFRNLADRDAVLNSIFELLAAGGVLVVQEYSIAGSRLWTRALWTAVCWLAIIPLGWLTSPGSRLYYYLWRSVRSFDSVEIFVDRLYGVGFVDVEVRSVSGWQRGILHTFRTRKPATVS